MSVPFPPHCRLVMMGRPVRLSVCLTVLLSGILNAPVGVQEVTLTLTEAVSQALTQGTDAKIARLETDKADHVLAAARSKYWPHASITSLAGYSNRQNEKLRAVELSGQERRYRLSTLGSERGWFNFFVDQLLFDLSTWRRIERAELEAEVARVAEAQQREFITFDVLQYYSQVLRQKQLVALDRQRIEAAEWLDQQAVLLLKAGRSLRSERDQVALNLEEVRLEAIIRQEDLADARASLAIAIGADRDGPGLQLAADSVPTPTDTADVFAGEDVLANSPELRVLELRTRMEELSLSAARAERYPKLGVQAGYSHYGTQRFDNFEDEVYIGVDFRLPLFDGYKTTASIAGAAKTAEIARLRYRSALETKRAQVQDLVRRLATASQRPVLAARRAKIAREQQRLADLNLQAQRGTLDQALSARTEAAHDSHAAINAHFDRIILWATLQRETGTLSAAITGELPERASSATP